MDDKKWDKFCLITVEVVEQHKDPYDFIKTIAKCLGIVSNLIVY